MHKDWMFWIVALLLFFAGAAWAQMMQALFGEERGFWYFLSEAEDAAAWAQAIGVMAAIFVSALIGKRQMDALLQERAYQFEQKRNAGIAIIKMSWEYAATIGQIAAARKSREVVAHSYFLHLQLAIQSCVASIDGFPWHEIDNDKSFFHVMQVKSGLVRSKEILDLFVAGQGIPTGMHKNLEALCRTIDDSARKAVGYLASR